MLIRLPAPRVMVPVLTSCGRGTMLAPLRRVSCPALACSAMMEGKPATEDPSRMMVAALLWMERLRSSPSRPLPQLTTRQVPPVRSKWP